MPTYSDIERARISESEKAAAETAKAVRRMQDGFYVEMWNYVSAAVETEAGRIKYTVGNLQKVGGLYRLFARLQKRFQKTLLGDVLNWVDKLLNLNGRYFETFANPAESVADAARRLTLQRWGYNVNTRQLIPGGYFEALFNNSRVAQSVASLVNQAIAQKMPLAKFQKAFRSAFVGKPGQGMLERHWKTNSFDLYQRIDRTANLIYADKLGLNYAIYSGTLMKDSRPFCVARVNKVFSRPQIAAWENLQFAGKPKTGYDPFTDCGGHNCRHHLSWISDEIAERLNKT